MLAPRPVVAFQLMLRVMREGLRPGPIPETGIPREYIRLMKLCWHPDYQRRPTFAAVTLALSKIDPGDFDDTVNLPRLPDERDVERERAAAQPTNPVQQAPANAGVRAAAPAERSTDQAGNLDTGNLFDVAAPGVPVQARGLADVDEDDRGLEVQQI